MANLLKKMNYSIVSLPKAINRTNPIPLDNSTVWTDFDELRDYAQTSPIAYVGQILSLVEYDSENGEISNTKAYIIKDKIGNIEEIGSIKNGDNVSIEFTNGEFSIKNFGKYYYKYITPTENNKNAHYELTEGWIAGLEPKVVEENGVMTIGWYESASITSENIQNQIINIQDEVGQTQQDIATLKTVINNVYKKDEVYTKEDINDLVSNAISGIFHFRGSINSFEELPNEGMEGDVYQIADKEYVWNGKEWIELGPLIDLGSYTTKTYVDDAITIVTNDLDSAEQSIKILQDANIENDKRIEHIEDQQAGFNNQFEIINNTIIDLEKTDENFATHLNTLKNYIGTPSGNLGAIYPTIESLNKRLNDIVIEGGGEPNQLNGISINGVAVPVNDNLIADLPTFTGSTAGLVPVVPVELTENYMLNAKGNWVNVENIISKRIEDAFTWSSIAE